MLIGIPVTPFHHHHAAARVLPVHFRHVEQIRSCEIRPQLGCRGCLAQQIELVEDGLFVLDNDLARVEPVRVGPVSMGQIGDEAQQAHVASYDPLDFGTHHLDHYLATVQEPCRVDLGDRCRRQRFACEFAEDLLDRTSERVTHDAGGRVARKRRHPVLQLGELVGDVFRQQIAAGVERIWPNLTKIGPRSSRARRSRIARGGWVPRTQFQGSR